MSLVRLTARDIEQRLLDRTFRENRKQLYSAIRLHISDPEAAHDVLQESFCILSRNSTRLDLLREARPYLFTVAVNLAKSWYTQRRNAELGLVETAVLGGIGDKQRIDALSEMERAEMVAAVHEAIAKLPDNERRVVHFHALQGLTFAQTAKEMGVSLRSAKRYMDAAKKRLRDWIGERFFPR